MPTPSVSCSPGRAELLAADPFFPAFVAGIESELSARNASLVLQVVADLDAELEVYRRMAADHRVDGVLLADLRVDDPRPSVLAELGLPAVTLGRPEGRAVLPGRGARRRARGRRGGRAPRRTSATDAIAFVGGPDEFLHSRHRRDAWRSTLERLGLPAELAVDGDFCGESGAAATAELLAPAGAPYGRLRSCSPTT